MKRKLFILGSGFTRAFCSRSPQMPEVLAKVEDAELLKRIVELKSYGISSPEKLLTLLTDSLYDASVDGELERLSAQVKVSQLIGNCFGDLVPDDVDLFRARIADRFTCDDNQIVDVVTFNYDTLVEDNSDNWEYIPRISESPYVGSSNTLSISAIKRRVGIVKLHGSVNWYSHSRQSQSLSDVFYVKGEDQARSSLRDIAAPVVVPFSYNRGHYTAGNLYPAIWRKFEFALFEADEIEIVGYGFPETDLYVIPAIMRRESKITRVITMEKPGNLPPSLETRLCIGDARDLF